MRRRRKISYRIYFPRLIMNLLIVAAVVGAGFVVAGMLTGEGDQTLHAVAGTPTGSVTTLLPDPVETPEPSFHKKEAEGLLVLVNWDNPVESGRPAGLVTMGEVFGEEVNVTNPDGSIHEQAAVAAKAMFMAARDEGIVRYKITSAYRSVEYQTSLWQNRTDTDPDYGSDPYAEPVKVMPGNMSEHSTGLALDILSDSYDSADDAYADTEEGRWLAENAYKYGFILRYPKGKEHITGVIFEPWHYRYVGVDAAREIHELGLVLEEYAE